MIPALPELPLPCNPLLPVPGCNPLGLGGGAGQFAGSAAQALLQAISSSLTEATAWTVNHVLGSADRPVDLGASWFTGALVPMKTVLEVVLLPVLLTGTAGAVLRQDLRRLGRIWGVGLPVAVLAGGSAGVLTGLGLRVTDALSATVLGSGLDVHRALSAFTTGSLATGSPLVVSAGIQLVALAGSVLVWLEMAVRSAAIYVAVFFAPLALVGYVWPGTAGMARRVVVLLATLVLSKFVIFATLALGLSAAGQGSSADQAVTGAGILLLASFAPYALMRLAPVVEVAAIAHLEGMSRRPLRAAIQASASAAGPGHPLVQRILAARGSAAPLSPSPVVAQPLPIHPPDYPLPPLPSEEPADPPASSQGRHG